MRRKRWRRSLLIWYDFVMLMMFFFQGAIDGVFRDDIIHMSGIAGITELVLIW